MTEIKADDQLQAVMERTMFNLRYIHERRSDFGPFEVVQLVNSFSGAMAHPWERMRGSKSLGLGKLSLEEARDRGWPVLEREFPHEVEPGNYGQMLQWIRNGFAHGNVNFENLEGNIVSIRVWNCPPRQPRNWGAVVPVRDMESFLWFFQDLASGQIPTPRSDDQRIIAHAAD